MEFGAREVAAKAPVVLLAAPEIELARELELEPVMESTKVLVTAQSNRWVLSSQPWVSFVVADPLTW